MSVSSKHPGPLPPDTESRIADFAELVATSIANADARTELAASRARIVAASDETRRRLERDLHDGIQQRLVSLALTLRAAQATTPPDLNVLQASLSQLAEGLAGALEELQEISRGIHPAILSEGGLGPALKTLARRSAVPSWTCMPQGGCRLTWRWPRTTWSRKRSRTPPSTPTHPSRTLTSKRPTASFSFRYATTVMEEPIRREGPASLASPTASKRWAERSRS
jgi:hypothetical protein